MDLFVACVPEQLVVQHHVFPSDCLVKLKLYLVHLVFWLHVNEKVSVVENSVDQ